MKSKLLIALLLVVVIGETLALVKKMQIKAMVVVGETFVPPPETIATAVATVNFWPDELPAVGTVNPEHGINLAPETGGSILNFFSPSGAEVAAGDLIVKLDTAAEEAQLRAAEAQISWSKVSAERLRKLRADNTASQSELDQAEAVLQQNEAAADNLRAIIAKKNLRAPFAGRLGIWQVNLGQLMEPGKPMVSLMSLAPLFVDFTLPQQELARLAPGQEVRVTADAYPTNVFAGEIEAINPDLNVATRSVSVRAKFANAEKLLRPGMFVRTSVVMPVEKKVLAIPATAVLSAPSGDSVFVITQPKENGGTNLVVQQKFIRTGVTRGDFIAVETGLAPGDRVVTVGIFKLRNGMTVVENNDLAPKPSLTPTPPNS